MFENLKLIECFEIADSKLRPFIEAISTGYGGAGPPATALVRPMPAQLIRPRSRTVQRAAVWGWFHARARAASTQHTHLHPAHAHAHAHSSQNAL